MKYDQEITDLTTRLFIVEGTISEILTRDTVENLNSKQGQQTLTAGALALTGQIGTAAVAYIAASDEGIDVSEFAIEVTDHYGELHYFRGCFPEVIFKVGDTVKVIAEPMENKRYARATALIDDNKNYIWTSQETIKGRLITRLFWIKTTVLVSSLSGFIAILVLLIFDGDNFIGNYDLILNVLIGIFIFIFIFIFIGWRVGASFDEQSVEFEAIAHKLGFHNPKMADLLHYSVASITLREDKTASRLTDRWQQYTYRLDEALKEDQRKYNKT